MFAKDKIIFNMCMAERHDYGLLHGEEKEELEHRMKDIFEKSFLPLLVDIRDDLACGCGHCKNVVEETINKAIGD